MQCVRYLTVYPRWDRGADTFSVILFLSNYQRALFLAAASTAYRRYADGMPL